MGVNKYWGRIMRGTIVGACLALSVFLVACGGQATSGGQASSSGESSAQQTASANVASWKTLSDALAAQTDSMASGWDDKYYVSVFRAGDSIVRVVAEIDDEANKRIEAVDWSKDNVGEQIEEAVGPQPLLVAEDITGELLDQNALDALVGKTPKELVDDGWVFNSYFMYGGEQTIATFAKGNLAYSLTFDITVPEDKTEDEGASVMDAAIVAAEFEGPSNSATDPSLVS